MMDDTNGLSRRQAANKLLIIRDTFLTSMLVGDLLQEPLLAVRTIRTFRGWCQNVIGKQLKFLQALHRTCEGETSIC
jgi:hypothetical protein